MLLLTVPFAWRNTLIPSSNRLKAGVHLQYWLSLYHYSACVCVYFLLTSVSWQCESTCVSGFFFYCFTFCAFPLYKSSSVSVWHWLKKLLNLLFILRRMMLWGETVETNWRGGVTQCRQNTTWCVSGLWNLKVTAGKRSAKLWFRSSTWGLFLCVWLTSICWLRRRWHSAQRSLCDQFFIAKLATVLRCFFSIQLGLNKERGIRSHNRGRFVFILSVILDFDLIPGFCNRPAALTLKHTHEFSPAPSFLFCAAE